MRTLAIIGAFATLLSLPAIAASPSARRAELGRFQQRIQWDTTNIPNYTCQETIGRTSAKTTRSGETPRFAPEDTVHLQVAVVDGRELFALPGATSFENRDAAAFVKGGAIGSGMFAAFARALFVDGKGAIGRRHAGFLDGHATVRYDFSMTREECGLKLQNNGTAAAVAVRGSFWFDVRSLDLLRIDISGQNIPSSLKLDEAFSSTGYSRVPIGRGNALLPTRCELMLTEVDPHTDASGDFILRVVHRDVIEFSGCREYGAQSVVSFGQ